MTVNGINVSVKGVPDISKEEIVNYINHIRKETHTPLASLEISQAENGCVALDYQLAALKFERIRRITGYLVGTIDRWNNSKQHEEQDRVKHGVAV